MVANWKTSIACGVFIVAGAVAPPGQGPALRALRQAHSHNKPVRLVTSSQRAVRNPTDRGATYYWLESRTTRVTTRFADATVVAERGADGDLQARLTGADGTELGRFNVDRIDAVNDVLEYVSATGVRLQAFNDPSNRPTLDWVNRQAYSLWRDRIGSADIALEWQNGVMRPRGMAQRDLDRHIVELKTEWEDGLSASAVRRSAVRHEAWPGRVLRGDVVVNRVTKDARVIGSASWFPEGQIFFWNLPGVTRGFVDADRLKEYGGWTFAPDAAWLNLQAIAFYHFKQLIDTRGVVARQPLSFPGRVLRALVPPLLANEPGCDGLHWLDGSILRYCCDTHDLCYAKYGCSSRSWWQWWSSWRCDVCNVGAVFCFARGGYEGPFYQYP